MTPPVSESITAKNVVGSGVGVSVDVTDGDAVRLGRDCVAVIVGAGKVLVWINSAAGTSVLA